MEQFVEIRAEQIQLCSLCFDCQVNELYLHGNGTVVLTQWMYNREKLQAVQKARKLMIMATGVVCCVLCEDAANRQQQNGPPTATDAVCETSIQR